MWKKKQRRLGEAAFGEEEAEGAEPSASREEAFRARPERTEAPEAAARRLTKQGLRAAEGGLFHQAQEAFRQALECGLSSEEAGRVGEMRAQALVELGEEAAAVAAAEAALRAAPHYAQARLTLARARRNQGHLLLCLQTYARLFHCEPWRRAEAGEEAAEAAALLAKGAQPRPKAPDLLRLLGQGFARTQGDPSSGAPLAAKRPFLL